MIKEKPGAVIPCCHFPTTVIFVDDDEKFLASLFCVLDHPVLIKTFSNPNEAEKFLIHEHHNTPFVKSWISKLSNDLDDNPSRYTHLGVNFLAIHSLIFNNNPIRFQEIPIIVLDFDLGRNDINGIQVATHLRNALKPYGVDPLILMLTGQADATFGLDALNKGIVNNFILKDSVDYTEQLNAAINQLQHQYFVALSKFIEQSLSINEISFFYSEEFNKIFNASLEEYSICEYYLLDEHGSFLMLDEKGKVYWFVIQDEEQTNEKWMVAKDLDAPQDIVNQLKKRDIIYFASPYDDPQFLSENVDKDEWSPYLYPVKQTIKINGKTYYFALAEPRSKINSLRKNFTSYRSYLRQN